MKLHCVMSSLLVFGLTAWWALEQVSYPEVDSSCLSDIPVFRCVFKRDDTSCKLAPVGNRGHLPCEFRLLPGSWTGCFHLLWGFILDSLHIILEAPTLSHFCGTIVLIYLIFTNKDFIRWCRTGKVFALVSSQLPLCLLYLWVNLCRGGGTGGAD